ncbi:MAG: Mur ligase family protein, partial [Steroidobacteraceae bacterium]
MTPRPLQRTAPGMPLDRLAAGLIDREMPGDLWIDDLTLDSRQVGRGSLYLACRGARHHGLEFARAAIEAGALAILFEPDGADRALPQARSAAQVSGILLEPVPRLKERAGALADRFFGFPSRILAVAGVTGTSGKTTTAFLIAQALTALGRPAGYIGTLGCGLPGSGSGASGSAGALQPFGLTTADAVTAHRQLAHLQALGAECVGMEVSSHALAQDRVSGIRFRAAAFTNLTRDHLDFHGSMEAYAAAKARLFERDLDARVINVDDEFGRDLARRFAGAPGRLVLTSRRGALSAQWRALPLTTRVCAHELQQGPEGSSFLLEVTPGARASAQAGARAGTRAAAPRVPVRLSLLGDFNIDNALTAAGVLLALDAAPEQIAAALGE